jgi:hypothetical protein
MSRAPSARHIHALFHLPKPYYTSRTPSARAYWVFEEKLTQLSDIRSNFS